MNRGPTEKQRRARAASIAAIRRKLGFAQTEFASLLGVHPITVSKWELAKAEPSPWHMSVIDALGTLNTWTQGGPGPNNEFLATLVPGLTPAAGGAGGAKPAPSE